ncbi:MAG: DUF1559 domain-containing protein [Rubripirellula sp.]|nr:DUF1559 domain-containing protein [Rubripirellula sp.]
MSKKRRNKKKGSHKVKSQAAKPNAQPVKNPARKEAKKESPRRSKKGLIFLFGIAALFIASLPLTVPLMQAVLETNRRASCSQHMEAIGAALKKYRDVNGSFPPAYTVNQQGQKLHSWRALILPYMDQQTVYDQIDFSKPWDDPVNRAAADTIISTYACPSMKIEPTQTTYVAVVDARGIMTGPEGTKTREVLDGLSGTIALVETDSVNAVHWMSPNDIDFQTFIGKGTQPVADGHMGGSHELMADGTVIFITDTIDPAFHEALLTKAGEEAIEAFLMM